MLAHIQIQILLEVACIKNGLHVMSVCMCRFTIHISFEFKLRFEHLTSDLMPAHSDEPSVLSSDSDLVSGCSFMLAINSDPLFHIEPHIGTTSLRVTFEIHLHSQISMP